MKFKLTTVMRGKGRVVIDMDGELDAVKTYIKLKIKAEDFEWGAIERTDELEKGDVDRWMIRRTSEYNRDSEQYEFGLILMPFSMHDVDPDININLYMAGMTTRQSVRQEMEPIDKLLGGGKF